jgi:hypothetical protein
LKFCQKQKGLILHGYVIMRKAAPSNHIHVIFQAETGNLSDLVRDFKAAGVLVFTAKQILKTIKNGPESKSDWMLKRFEFAAKSQSRNSKHQFWEYGNHPEEIFSEIFFWTKLNRAAFRYIHMNPVRSNFGYKNIRIRLFKCIKLC